VNLGSLSSYRLTPLINELTGKISYSAPIDGVPGRFSVYDVTFRPSSSQQGDGIVSMDATVTWEASNAAETVSFSFQSNLISSSSSSLSFPPVTFTLTLGYGDDSFHMVSYYGPTILANLTVAYHIVSPSQW
jgi:hypothetical protein